MMIKKRTIVFAFFYSIFCEGRRKNGLRCSPLCGEMKSWGLEVSGDCTNVKK